MKCFRKKGNFGGKSKTNVTNEARSEVNFLEILVISKTLNQQLLDLSGEVLFGLINYVNCLKGKNVTKI